MNNISSNWQDSLDRKLVNRLTRPLHQPGMMKMAMGQNIINRCDRFLNRLPLINQQMQRWGNINIRSSDSVPIVYAQSIPLAKKQTTEGRGNRQQAIGNSSRLGQGFGQSNVDRSQSSVPIVQRKLASSQSLNVLSINNISSENKSSLSSSNFSNRINSSPSLGDRVNPTFISSSSDSSTQNQINTSDRSQETSLLSIQSSQRINSLSNSLSPLKRTPFLSQGMNLSIDYGKNKSPLDRISIYPSSPSTQDGITDNHPTSNSSPKNPIVSPQSIFKNFVGTNQVTSPHSEYTETLPYSRKESGLEVPLIKGDLGGSKSKTNNSSSSNQNQIDTSDRIEGNSLTNNQRINFLPNSVTLLKRTPILNQEMNLKVPLNKGDLGGSPSSLPVVNPLNNLVSAKLDRSNKYFENSNSTKQKNLAFQFSTDNLPIVTAQSLKTQINSSLKPQSLPLPLVKNSPSSKSSSQQTNISQQNSRISNTDSFSSSKVYSNPSLTQEITTAIEANKTNSKIDLDTIADRVERKLMRRLVIEGERRGKIR